MSCHMMKCNVNRKIMNRYIIVEFAPRSSNDNETVGHLCVLYDIFFYISLDSLLNSGPGTNRAGPELALFSPGGGRRSVGRLASVTLSSRAPKQPAQLKFGTDLTFKE